MVFKFPCRVHAVLQDLRRCGHTGFSVEKIEGARGRSVDVHFVSGAVLSYDKVSGNFWVEGPFKERSALEIQLILLYTKGAWIRRAWIAWRTLYQSRFLQIRRAKY